MLVLKRWHETFNVRKLERQGRVLRFGSRNLEGEAMKPPALQGGKGYKETRLRMNY